jgi:hypothetical protein
MKLGNSLEERRVKGMSKVAGNETASPGLGSVEKTMDLNELPRKRVARETSEERAGSNKTSGRWTKAEHARFVEGKVRNKE